MARLGYLRRDGMELIVCKQSGISYPLHNHVSVFTLGFLLGGAVELVTDKGRGIYQEGDAFVILPYTPHCVNAKPRYTLLSLCINTEWLIASENEKRKAEIAAFLHDAINRPAVEETIGQALNGLAAVARMLPMQKETALSRLKTQLERYPERRFPIEDMARRAFISKYHLIRTFKDEVGLTPHQFQIQNRVRKAQRLLEGPATITETALAAGFCDQSHFIRQFEKIVGLTPTDYRRACALPLPVSID